LVYTKGDEPMYENINPVEEYVKIIKQNADFLNRLLTPKISIPFFAIFVTIIGVIALSG
jgi:hypothetical protein